MLLVVFLKVSLFSVEPYFFVFTLIVISQILVLINTKKIMTLCKIDSLSKVPLIALLSKCFYLEDHQIFTTYVCMKLLLYIFCAMKNGGGAIITSTSAHWSIDFDIGIPMRMEIHDLNDKVLIDFLRPLTPPPMNDPWSYI